MRFSTRRLPAVISRLLPVRHLAVVRVLSVAALAMAECAPAELARGPAPAG